MSGQPEALRLANRMALIGASMDGDADRAAAELRRLHALCEEMGEALVDSLDFLERHSNRWDGANGKHPFPVCEAARSALAKWKESK